MKRQFVPCLLMVGAFYGVTPGVGRATPLDEFYKLEEQLIAAHEAHMFATEAFEAEPESKRKPPVDNRPALLKQMDALVANARGAEDAAPIALGAFFWSWNLDLDLEKLLDRFAEIVRHYANEEGLDDILPETVEIAMTLEQPEPWAALLERLALSATRRETRTGALVAQGQLLLRAGKPDKARIAFHGLLALKPDAELVALAKGYIHEIEHLQVGMIAPNFTTRTLDGRELSLTSFRGKTVLLSFWASW